jgi:hypothetical protein
LYHRHYIIVDITVITKVEEEKNQCIREKNGSTKHSKGYKTVPGKVATTRTEDGHKQNSKTGATI